jgi:hypothetical protein
LVIDFEIVPFSKSITKTQSEQFQNQLPKPNRNNFKINYQNPIGTISKSITKTQSEQFQNQLPKPNQNNFKINYQNPIRTISK